MHNILIVENDLEQQNTLKELIQRQFPDWFVACADNYQSASSLIEDSVRENKVFSLFILEIQLGENPDALEGFTLAGEVRAQKVYQMAPIMFLAPDLDMIQEAISEYHCYYYIRKPFSSESIAEKVQQMCVTGALPENAFDVTDISRVHHRIPLQDICYVEAESHRVKVVTLTSEIITREFSFAAIQERLSGELIRCHRKYLINLQYFSIYDRANRFIMINDCRLPVSRSYKNMLESRII